MPLALLRDGGIFVETFPGKPMATFRTSSNLSYGVRRSPRAFATPFCMRKDT